jgi:hypothetical protein
MTVTGGTLLQTEEIVKALPDDELCLRYGWDKVGEVKRVGVFEGDSKAPSSARHWTFPEGMYD